MVHDAVQIFARAMEEMENNESGVETAPQSCKQPSPWEYGMRIVEYMKMVSHGKDDNQLNR